MCDSLDTIKLFSQCSVGKAANVLVFGAKFVKALISKEIWGKALQNAQKTFPCTPSLLKELHPLQLLPIGIWFCTAFKAEGTAGILPLPVLQTQPHAFSNFLSSQISQ